MSGNSGWNAHRVRSQAIRGSALFCVSDRSNHFPTLSKPDINFGDDGVSLNPGENVASANVSVWYFGNMLESPSPTEIAEGELNKTRAYHSSNSDQLLIWVTTLWNVRGVGQIWTVPATKHSSNLRTLIPVVEEADRRGRPLKRCPIKARR